MFEYWYFCKCSSTGTFVNVRVPLLTFDFDTAAGVDMNIRTTADLGALIRDRRLAAGVTQAELAQRAGVGRAFLVRLEHGHPTLEVGRVLAVIEALDLILDATEAKEPAAASPDSRALLDSIFESLNEGDGDR